MSKPLVHVGIPHEVAVACGMHGYVRNAAYRDQVTCLRCKKTDLYKSLKRSPKPRKGLAED